MVPLISISFCVRQCVKSWVEGPSSAKIFVIAFLLMYEGLQTGGGSPKDKGLLKA